MCDTTPILQGQPQPAVTTPILQSQPQPVPAHGFETATQTTSHPQAAVLFDVKSSGAPGGSWLTSFTSAWRRQSRQQSMLPGGAASPGETPAYSALVPRTRSIRLELSFAFNPAPSLIPVALEYDPDAFPGSETSSIVSSEGEALVGTAPRGNPYPGLTLAVPADRHTDEVRMSSAAEESVASPTRSNINCSLWFAVCVCTSAAPTAWYAVLTAHKVCSSHAHWISFWGPACGFAATALSLFVVQAFLRNKADPAHCLLAANAASAVALGGAAGGCGVGDGYTTMAAFVVCGVVLPLAEISLCDVLPTVGGGHSLIALIRASRIAGGVAGVLTVAVGACVRLLVEGEYDKHDGALWAQIFLVSCCCISATAVAAQLVWLRRAKSVRLRADAPANPALRQTTGAAVFMRLPLITQFAAAATSGAAWPGAPCSARGAGSSAWVCSPASIGAFAGGDLIGRLAASMACGHRSAAEAATSYPPAALVAALLRAPVAVVVWALAAWGGAPTPWALLGCTLLLGAGGGALGTVGAAHAGIVHRRSGGAAEAMLLALYAGHSAGAIGAAVANTVRPL
eukprot:TRINITY_DN6653_c0_g2_i1.p1 TRINITY_DN6653_c0_g2~~TRINITY_DN6653_c0_g2_i1.p1  ORF type:complete len:570 (+),score=66.73 TRINITY_DN6653_c0_g2_i1:168-1877(+)